ncbi:MAG: hypothetical protein ACR2F4_02110 [Thermoleophilaceae bacterium]
MEGWIFMVGFRVFDVGLLILWLVWFFRLRSDGSDTPPEDDDGGGGGGPERTPEKGPGGGGLQLPDGPVPHGRGRVRDGHRPPRTRRRGTSRPVPGPLPARVRSPGAPARVTRRS